MSSEQPYLKIGNWLFRPDSVTHAAVSDDRQQVTLHFISGDDLRLIDAEAEAVAGWLLAQADAIEVKAEPTPDKAPEPDKAPAPRRTTSRRRKAAE